MPKRKEETAPGEKDHQGGKSEEEKKIRYSDSVIYEGEAQKIDVEEEARTMSAGGKFNPKKLAEALVFLGQKMLGVELYGYQQGPAYRIIYSMLKGDGAQITLLFSRQSGKSEVVTFCVVIIGIMFPVLGKMFKELAHFSNGVKMGLFAPQMDQVETVYQRCMERITSEHTQLLLEDPDVDDGLTSKVHFRLKSGSFLKAQSAAKQSKIESKTYHLALLDETQDIDSEKITKSIIPMTASTFGTIVRLGTPNRNKGNFYYMIQHNKKQDRIAAQKNGGTVPPEKQLHFQFAYKDIIRYKKQQFAKDGKIWHTYYEKSVQRDVESMGKNSESFRMSYALEWLFDVGMFITEERLEAKVLNRKIKLPDIDKDDFIVAGLDIASARANTILTLGKCSSPIQQEFGEKPIKTVCEWVELGGSYEEQYPILVEFLTKANVKVLYADYTGVGRAITDRLIHDLGEFIQIIPYTFTVISKSDMWKALDEEISAGRIVVPASKSVQVTPEFENFCEQMLNLQKSWKGSYMICEKGQGFNDDYPDSLALMALAGNHLYSAGTVEIDHNFLLRDNRGSYLTHRNSGW